MADQPPTIPELARTVKRNQEETDKRFDKIEESLRWLSRLVIGGVFSILVAVVVAIVTRSI
jgi:CHASE3 domain sensor protein